MLGSAPTTEQWTSDTRRDKTETDAAAWRKLKDFRSKVESRHTCVYWTTAEELRAKVIVGLTSSIKRSPAVGWVRADKVPTDATVEEILRRRQEISKLQTEAAAENLRAPEGSEELLQGSDTLTLSYSFQTTDPTSFSTTNYSGKVTPTWDAIFGAVAPAMIEEASEQKLRAELMAAFESFARSAVASLNDTKFQTARNFKFQQSDVSTCIVQLRALGLIRGSARKRSVKDTGAYWSLTPLGDQRMVQIRALRKSPVKPVFGTLEGAGTDEEPDLDDSEEEESDEDEADEEEPDGDDSDEEDADCSDSDEEESDQDDSDEEEPDS